MLQQYTILTTRGIRRVRLLWKATAVTNGNPGGNGNTERNQPYGTRAVPGSARFDRGNSLGFRSHPDLAECQPHAPLTLDNVLLHPPSIVFSFNGNRSRSTDQTVKPTFVFVTMTPVGTVFISHSLDRRRQCDIDASAISTDITIVTTELQLAQPRPRERRNKATLGRENKVPTEY